MPKKEMKRGVVGDKVSKGVSNSEKEKSGMVNKRVKKDKKKEGVTKVKSLNTEKGSPKKIKF